MYILVFFLVTLCLRAQPSEVGVHTLSGEVHAQHDSSFLHLRVVLMDSSSRSPLAGTMVGPTGKFDLTRLPSGVFRAVLLGATGDELAFEYVTLPTRQSLEFRLPQSVRPSAAVAAPVSLHQLRHRVPKKALRLGERAQRHFQSQEWRKAIELLESALTLDPNYALGHALLGSALLQVDEFPKAMLHLDRSIDLDGSSGEVLIQAGLAHHVNGDQAGAEAIARRALRLLPGKPKALYLLGLALVHQRKFTPEAAESLKRASAEFPRAQQLLSGFPSGAPK